MKNPEMRQMVRVGLLRVLEDDEEDWPPTRPGEFMAWWMKKIALIPAEYERDAEVHILNERDGLEIVINYKRPETDEEMKRRQQANKTRELFDKEQRRKTFLRLKEEFEPTQI